MKIGTVFVTYNPELPLLEKAVTAVENQTSYVYIVDNGSQNVNQISELVNEFNNVELIKLGQNLGIAKAQNTGFLNFEKKQYDFVLTLDQDTVLPDDYIQNLLPLTESENVGIVTGAFVDLRWTEEDIKKKKKQRTPDVQELTHEIASGNIVSIKAWKEVKGFDEKLFIDYVDFDFDYKLVEAGYFIYRDNRVEFEHEIGAKVDKNILIKPLFLSNHDISDHSPQRLYFINRNRLIVIKRHPKFGSYKSYLTQEILNLREILVMESPKMKKMVMAIKGIIHGVFSKY